MKTQFRVLMPVSVLNVFTAYIMSVNYEISGLGIVEVQHQINGIDFLIKEIQLIKQISSGVSTHLNRIAMAQFIGKMFRDGKDVSALRLWWHSHGDLDVFWSGTDENNIQDFNDNNKDWMLSIVGNRRGKILARVDLYRPFPFTIGDIEVSIISDVDHILQDQINREVDEKVEYSKPLIPDLPYSPNGYQFGANFEWLDSTFPDERRNNDEH